MLRPGADSNDHERPIPLDLEKQPNIHIWPLGARRSASWRVARLCQAAIDVVADGNGHQHSSQRVSTSWTIGFNCGK